MLKVVDWVQLCSWGGGRRGEERAWLMLEGTYCKRGSLQGWVVQSRVKLTQGLVQNLISDMKA